LYAKAVGIAKHSHVRKEDGYSKECGQFDNAILRVSGVSIQLMATEGEVAGAPFPAKALNARRTNEIDDLESCFASETLMTAKSGSSIPLVLIRSSEEIAGGITWRPTLLKFTMLFLREVVASGRLLFGVMLLEQ
jgi:hypothetical protein